MADPPESIECVTSAFETPEGWAYTCLCGYESRPTLTRQQAISGAITHAQAFDPRKRNRA